MAPTPRIGIGIPNFGPTPERVGIPAMARAIEAAGFESAWLTDHLLIPDHISSRYPFTEDGRFSVPAGGVWYEPLATLGVLAGATTSLMLGVGVLVLPLREPRLFAAQSAAIDRLSGGRLLLGIGTGWLAEEYEALEVPFSNRGARLDGAIDLIRHCWSGRPAGGTYGPYTLTEGLTAEPRPHNGTHVPLILTGYSDRALDRIAAHGDGWYGGLGPNDELQGQEVARVREGLLRRCDERGRDPGELSLTIRVSVSSRTLPDVDRLAERLHAFHLAGADRFVVDFGWPSLEQGTGFLESLRPLLERLI